MTAPFSAAAAAGVVAAFAAINFALGAIALMLAGPCRFATRALLLGVALTVMAGAIGSMFA